MKKIFVTATVVVILVSSMTSCLPAISNIPDVKDESSDVSVPSTPSDLLEDATMRYNRALSLLDSGEVEQAYTLFLSIRDYGDVSDYLKRFCFRYEVKEESNMIGQPYTYYEYDTYGKVTYERHASSTDSGYSYRYEYDQSERLTKCQYESHTGKQTVCLYEYDAGGNLIQETVRDGQTATITTVEYDDRGNRIKVYGWNATVVLEYKYDDANNLLEEVVKDQNGTQTEAFFYEYDSRGNLIRSTLQYPSSQQTKIFQYDGQNRLISVKTEYGDGTAWSLQKIEYDGEGNRQRTVNSSFSEEYGYQVTSWKSWKYDEAGNVTEELEQCLDGILNCRRYEYDGNGNCVKETYEMPALNRIYVSLYQYDQWGNLLKKESSHTEGTVSYVGAVYNYRGYKLYYNPYPTQDLPLHAVN